MKYISMISANDFENEEAHQTFLAELETRVHKKKTLLYDEQEYFCNCSRYEYQKTIPFCDPFRFKRLFLKYFDSKQKGYELEDFEIEDLDGFLKEWRGLMKKENNSENLLNVLSIETRSELKKILPDFSFFDKMFRKREYQTRQNEIVGYSKYAYVRIKATFVRHGSDKVITRLNQTDIEIDEYTLAHVYMRHYGQLVRPYDTSDKTYFTPEVRIEEVPFVIKEIIDAIEASEFYVACDIRNINVRYKGRDYKIYCVSATKQVRGVGNVTVTRVSTFYPIELQQDVDKLSDYNMININADLSVYIRKEAPSQ